ncbi:hypothetical protein F4781DRAFT_113155 [Annulohypoxylon bovei var. microspora]|nr:hypothetical protein F4781DRAFT_113155 [Annulohypoxylon bovei var. microspora]
MASSLKSILRKSSVDETEAPDAGRKMSVCFEDVLARDGEGKAVSPTTKSRDEWLRDVDARRGAKLIDQFRAGEGAGLAEDGPKSTYTYQLVENPTGNGEGMEVVLYAKSEDGSDEETDDEAEDDDGGEKIEVIFEIDDGDDDDDDDDQEGDDDDDDDDDDEEDEEEEKKDDNEKGEKDSMTFARTFLQSEIGNRYPMCERVLIC